MGDWSIAQYHFDVERAPLLAAVSGLRTKEEYDRSLLSSLI